MQSLTPAGDELLPWLAEPWQRLWSAYTDGRLGHALLVSGPAGIGKRLLAGRLARAIMCTAPGADGSPCGNCPDCRLTASGNHPDIVLLEPDSEAKTREIKVDQVRMLCGQQALTSNRGPRKVLLVVPAEAMNPFAANSLLKTLEEPVASTLWILVSEDPARLTQTIRSRCQRTQLPAPPEQVALPWLRGCIGDGGTDPALLLRLAHGAPLTALALAESDRLDERAKVFDGFVAVGLGKRDPVGVADAWQGLEPALVLDALAGWLCDVIRLGVAPQAAHIGSPDKRRELQALAAAVDPRAGHRYLSRILGARGLAEVTINKQLLYESLLVRWALLAQGQETDGW